MMTDWLTDKLFLKLSPLKGESHGYLHMLSIIANVLTRTFLIKLGGCLVGVLGMAFWKARPGKETERKKVEVLFVLLNAYYFEQIFAK